MENSEDFGLKIGIHSCLYQYMKRIMCTKNQGHSLTRDSHSMIILYLSKATGTIVIKILVEPPGVEGTKIYKQLRSHDQHDRPAHIW